MIFALALASILIVAIGYTLAMRYLRRATNSLRSAEIVEAKLATVIHEFVESDAPPEVAQLAIRLGATAGCGCFVRGVLMNHYLPRASMPTGPDADEAQAVFKEAQRMSSAQQEMFSRIVGGVIVYDSFSNPLQGWLLRRLITSYSQPSQSWADQLEAKLAAFSVVSRRYHAAH